MPAIFPRTLAQLLNDAYRRQADAIRVLRTAAAKLPRDSDAVSLITDGLADLEISRCSLEAASLEAAKYVEHEQAIRDALTPIPNYRTGVLPC